MPRKSQSKVCTTEGCEGLRKRGELYCPTCLDRIGADANPPAYCGGRGASPVPAQVYEPGSPGACSREGCTRGRQAGQSLCQPHLDEIYGISTGGGHTHGR
jgi:hypothetical protein